MNLRDIAIEAAGELSEIHSHAQLYLERLVTFFAERPTHAETFAKAIANRKLQVDAERAEEASKI